MGILAHRKKIVYIVDFVRALKKNTPAVDLGPRIKTYEDSLEGLDHLDIRAGREVKLTLEDFEKTFEN